MIIHACILTMGNQANIDRLFSDCFWRSVWGRVGMIYVLSQCGSVTVKSPNRHLPIVRYFESEANLGCAGGRKFLTEKIMKSRFCGEAFGEDDAIIFLDDDVQVISEDWIRQLCEPLLGEYSISGVAGRRVTEDVWTVVDMESPSYVSGGWAAFRGDVFLDGCMFDDKTFPINYWEDADLANQATAKGKKLIAVGEIGLAHEDNPIGRDMVEVSKHVLENRIKFANKWGMKI
jgi:GT2 family glycosyltransferase